MGGSHSHKTGADRFFIYAVADGFIGYGLLLVFFGKK